MREPLPAIGDASIARPLVLVLFACCKNQCDLDRGSNQNRMRGCTSPDVEDMYRRIFLAEAARG